MNETPMSYVSGSLFYRERMALPPDAQVSVELAYREPGTEKVIIIGLHDFQQRRQTGAAQFRGPL